MSQPESSRAHVYDVLSRIGLYGGLILLALVVTAEIAANADDTPGSPLIRPPFTSLTYLVLVGIMLCSFTTQLHLRLRGGQLAIEERLADLQTHLAGLQNFVVLAEQDRTRRAPVVAHVYAGRASMREADTEAIEKPELDATVVEPPEKVPGLTPEMVEIAKRTTRRLRGQQ